MYYGKQNNLNNDYYNSSYQYRNEKDYLTLTFKILIILLLLGLLFIGFIFMSNKTKIVEKEVTTVEKQSLFKIMEEEPLENTKELSKKILKEIALAKNNNTHLKKVDLTQEDIANIVSIVMRKMNSCQIDSFDNDND
ncbi:MAG: hypothetical protein KAU90_01405, partial [Sulfurovaceae bacterium]|nr:hypothetical protein [Sulfurovaceae bacterium]